MRTTVKKVSALMLAYILAFTGIPVSESYAAEDPTAEEPEYAATASPLEALPAQASPTEVCQGGEEEDVFLAESTQNFSFVFEYGQSQAREMLPLINELRSGKNAWAYDQSGSRIEYGDLPKLSYDYALEQIAMQRAAEIAVMYSSVRPDGSSYMTCKYDSVTSAGENILYAKDGAVTAADAMEIFKETAAGWSGQTRRRRMLDSSYTAVGIGFASYGGYSLWVQEFGGSVSLSPAAEAVDAERTVSIDIRNSNITETGDFSPDRRYITLVLGSPADMTLAEHSLPAVTRTIKVAGSPEGLELHTAPSEIVWTTEYLSVVRVIGERVLAAGPGRATLTGDGADWNGDVTVTVVVPATGVKFRPSEVQLAQGDTYQTQYDASPANAFGYVVSYRSENPAVAVIDEKGVITAVGKGETVVEVSLTTREIDFVRTATCYVVVKGKASDGPDINDPSILTSKDLIAKQQITVYSNLKITRWKTSSKKVAKVKKMSIKDNKWRARVTAIDSGDAVISGYNRNRLIFKCHVHVEKPVFIKDPVVTYDSFYMIGRITNVETANPSKYKSSKPEVLSIDRTTGEVTVLKNGRVRIYVYYGKIRYRVKLRVKLPRIKQDSVKIKRGKTKKLKIRYKRTDTVYEWRSSKPGVAWVDQDGRVHAVKKGKTWVTLWVNGVQYDKCLVRVKK